MFAEDLQYIRQQSDAGAEENESDDIKRVGLLFAVVGQMQMDEDQACEADGDIEEEDEAPVQIADDEASGDGSEHRSYQGRDGDEAHGADEFGFGECSHQGEPADGDHHRSAAALQDAARDQQVNVARYST